MAFLGESAALGTAALWSITSLLFTFAVTRMGSLALNLVRLTLAAAGLLAIALAVEGSGWLTGMRWPDAVFLAASGFVGLTVGDWVYFKALHMIGARQGTLLMALAPAVTVVLAMPVLNERPGPYAILGMALTMTGVLWVVLERPNVPAPAGHRVRGAFFGGLGACCQAGGLILSKLGMRGIVGPLPASAVRMTFGAAGVWLLFLLSRRRPALVRPLQDSRLLAAVIAASILGPIAGIWLSLVAVQNTQAGIAATLMATVPVLVLPLVVWVQKESVSGRAVAGALVAVSGVAVLFVQR